MQHVPDRNLHLPCPQGKEPHKHDKCDACAILFRCAPGCDYMSTPTPYKGKTLCQPCIVRWKKLDKRTAPDENGKQEAAWITMLAGKKDDISLGMYFEQLKIKE